MAIGEADAQPPPLNLMSFHPFLVYSFWLYLISIIRHKRRDLCSLLPSQEKREKEKKEGKKKVGELT